MEKPGLSRFMPAFIPILFELFRQFKRNALHDESIRKTDKSAEKLATIEHMLVRLERKIQHNRDTYEKIASRVMIWLIINSALLVAILVKLLFF